MEFKNLKFLQSLRFTTIIYYAIFTFFKIILHIFYEMAFYKFDNNLFIRCNIKLIFD